MTGCKPVDVPPVPGEKLTVDISPQREDEKKLLRILYQEAVGILLLAGHLPRPNSSYYNCILNLP